MLNVISLLLLVTLLLILVIVLSKKKLPFNNNTTRSKCIFDLLHIDIWGACPVLAMRGFKYFLIVVDDCSHFTWTIPMPNKFVACKYIMDFVNYTETQFDTKLKSIRTDNGLEFCMTNFYALKGIIHQTTCVETPEQNGIVEQKHQYLLNVVRALIFHAHLPTNFWCFALNHAAFFLSTTHLQRCLTMIPLKKFFMGNYRT